MNLEQRLDKVSKHLTPKQAVVAWLQDIRKFPSLNEYVRFVHSRQESEAPISKLTTQVREGIEAEMKGSKKEAIIYAQRRADRDVIFLVKLQQQANVEILIKQRAWHVSQVALSEALRGWNTEVILRNVIVDLAERVNFETPYPLEPDVAATVEAAIRNHVTTWESMEDMCVLQDWLSEYFSQNNATQLPLNAYHYPEGKYTPTVTPENGEQVQACFKDVAEFELFRSGQDYTHGFASVNDAEYNRHYGLMVNGIRELINSGQVDGGAVVALEMIPIAFLQEIPLVEGKWLDRRVLELAEWSSLLHAQGYHLKEEDRPLLSSAKFIRENGEEITPTELQTFCHKAVRNLARFPGRTRKIQERLYLHFEDYCAWRGRKVKGDLQALVKEGLMTASWNRWVSEHGGENAAKVAGVLVGSLSCYVNESDYYPTPHDTEEHLREREQLLENFRTWSFKPDRKQDLIQEWKEAVHYCLVELYAFRQGVTSIEKTYFKGQPALFSDVTKDLADLTTEAEGTVNNFNTSFAGDIKLFPVLDLEGIRSNADQEVNRVMAYIVDMAKAEALDFLDEGDRGVELVERYI